jgi:hypothetical protein
MTSTGLNISFGTLLFKGTEAMLTCLQALEESGVKEIDTAHM